jgi:outer membrane receptor for ferrienterochelin and colicins
MWEICALFMNRLFTLFIFSLFAMNLFAQDSLVVKIKEEVIVTATKSPTKIKNIAVPISIITKSQIIQSGALKMNDLLQEQTGIFVTNGSGSKAVGGGIFGNGLQLQGMSPEHTLIMVDGEMVSGRQGGILDLSRIVVGNIKSIEIIKGPFSSLYGSEAMAGVINIITEMSKKNKVEIALRYGSFLTSDVQVKANFNNNKWQHYFFVNTYATNGYDLNTKDIEQTVDANKNTTFQYKTKYTNSDTWNFTLNTRIYNGEQKSKYAINANYINIDGAAITKDMATTVQLNYNFTKQINTSFTLFYNQYKYNQQLDSVINKSIYYKDNFLQNVIKVEQLTNFNFNKKILSILGYGYIYQTVLTERYDRKKTQNAFYLFNQNEIKITDKIKTSAGIRVDVNNAYKYSVNPKIAVAWNINEKLKVTASIGTGFKAPDFRQLYLSFINNAADNYIIYGVQEFSMQKLQQQLTTGFIAQILPSANLIKTLQPEQSIGYNAGIQYAIADNLKLDAHIFRNDINNLIQYIEIAKRANGASVFSYINVTKTFTQGLETNLFVKYNKNFNVQAGYQYVLTGDKEIVQKLKDKQIYGRDAVAAPARIMQSNDYNGLQNRSKHLANMKLSYSKNNLTVSVRGMYKSKWGVRDFDGNGFANMPEEFAKGFVQLSSTALYKINKHWNMQLGINNIANYIDAVNVTNIAGRNYFTTINYTL